MADPKDPKELFKRLGLKPASELPNEGDRGKPRPNTPKAPPSEGTPLEGGFEGASKGENTEETPQPTFDSESKRRLNERLGLMSGLALRRERQGEDLPRKKGLHEVDRVLGGEIIGDPADGFFLFRNEYPVEHLHGDMPLAAAFSSSAEHLALVGNDNSLVECKPARAFFMDTETTGLAGGAGTVAFLVGIGRFTEEGMFRLDQCFMRDYDDEEPMLRWLAAEFRECDTVVSFNGKSFDLPLLRTRFVQQRVPFPLDGALHLDLVHTARRFWKRRLNDCSLGNLEREVLGVRRHGDVPGHLIPQLWLEYLHSRDARPLEGVFYHHRFDILSMVTLVGLLGERLSRPEGSEFECHEDQLSLVRLHFKKKQYDKVVTLAKSYLEENRETPLRRECLEMLSLACKRRARFAELLEALESWHREFPGDAEAAAELSKHLEHQLRDLRRAARVCAETLEKMRDAGSFYRNFAENPRRTALEQRMARIQAKLTRRAPNDLEYGGED